MFRLARLLSLALLLNLGAASGLMAADWKVVKVVGLVWVVGEDIEPQRAAPGMVLPDNATIATTARARAMLRHGEDILNLGPNTHVAPQARRVRGLTTVLMRKGDLDLDIEHRGRPHFSVQTPFLAAVVKGTRFQVSVHSKAAAVAVRTGRVQVVAFAARKSVDVTDGQKAAVVGDGLRLSGSGTFAPVRSGASQRPLVEADAEDVGAGSAAAASAASSASRAASAAANAAEAAENAADAAEAAADAANSNAGAGNNNAGGNSDGAGNSENSNAGGNGNGRN